MVPVGIVVINATFNNTIITITNLRGDVVAWSSSGANNFRGAKKSTPHAAQVAAENAAQKALVLGMKAVSIVLNGAGAGRESAVRAIANIFEEVRGITDRTGIPHNGVRPRKKRRV